VKKPSEHYYRCLAEAQAHHASSKTYSGKFLRPHAPFIKAIIDRLECKSVLDYGCGKGVQYQWVSHGDDASIPKGMTIEEYWGVPVTLFDPAYPPYAKTPTGHFDLVVCTHALGSIPVDDLPWAIDQLTTFATRAVYIAEKIGEVRKQVFADPGRMPRWTAVEWRAFIAARPHNGCEITIATRERRENGQVIVERHIV